MKDATIDRLWEILLGSGLVLLFFVLDMLLNMIASIVQSLNSGGSRILSESLWCLFSVLSALTFLLLLKKLNLFTIDSTFFTFKKLGIVLLGLGLFRLLLIICSYFMAQQGMSQTVNDQLIFEATKGIPLPLVLFVYSVCTPIMEEAVFRGSIIGLIFRDHFIFGIIISSFIFGALHHPTNIYSWIIYSGFAVILGVIYGKTKQIGLPIAIHILNNFIGFMLMQPV